MMGNPNHPRLLFIFLGSGGFEPWEFDTKIPAFGQGVNSDVVMLASMRGGTTLCIMKGCVNYNCALCEMIDAFIFTIYNTSATAP